MTDPVKLELLISSEPELVLKSVLEAISGKPYEKPLDMKVVKDFVGFVKYCAGPKSMTAGLGQEATDKCVLTQAIHAIAANKLLTKNEVEKRISEIGLEGLVKEVGKAIEKAEAMIKEKETSELLKAFESKI